MEGEAAPDMPPDGPHPAEAPEAAAADAAPGAMDKPAESAEASEDDGGGIGCMDGLEADARAVTDRLTADSDNSSSSSDSDTQVTQGQIYSTGTWSGIQV